MSKVSDPLVTERFPRRVAPILPEKVAIVPGASVRDWAPASAPSIVPPKEIAPVVVMERVESSVEGTLAPTVNVVESMEEPPSRSERAPAATSISPRAVRSPKLPERVTAPEAVIARDWPYAEVPLIAPPKEVAPEVAIATSVRSVEGMVPFTTNEAASMELHPRVREEAPAVTETLPSEVVEPRSPDSATLAVPGVKVRLKVPSIVPGMVILPGPVEVFKIEEFVSKMGEAVAIENESEEMLPPMEMAFGVVAALRMERPPR